MFCTFGLGSNLTLESFQLCLLVVLTVFSHMRNFFRKLNHRWKCTERKDDFQTILVIKLEPNNVLVQVWLGSSKTKLDAQYNKLVK